MGRVHTQHFVVVFAFPIVIAVVKPAYRRFGSEDYRDFQEAFFFNDRISLNSGTNPRLLRLHGNPAAGFYSMGGNLVLKAAGELGSQVPRELVAVVAVSPPMA